MSKKTGMWFEEFEPGQSYSSAGRTMTETDLTMFSMLSGDWNPIHADAEFCKSTKYGQRLIHGALGIAISTGMMHELGIFQDTAVAMLAIRDWQFTRPIFVGDTLHLKLDILDCDGSRSTRMGSVDRRFTLINQNDEIAQVGQCAVLMLKRPA